MRVVPAQRKLMQFAVVDIRERNAGCDVCAANMERERATAVDVHVELIRRTGYRIRSKCRLTPGVDGETRLERELLQTSENGPAIGCLQISIIAAVGVQFDTARQIGRCTVRLQQIVQRNREHLVVGVGVDVGDAHRNAVTRIGLVVQQRTVGDSDLAAGGVDGEGAGDGLRLDAVGQGLSGVEYGVGVPFGDVVEVGADVGVVPLHQESYGDGIVAGRVVGRVVGDPIGIAAAGCVTGFVARPEQFAVGIPVEPAPLAFGGPVRGSQPGTPPAPVLDDLADEGVLGGRTDGDQLPGDAVQGFRLGRHDRRREVHRSTEARRSVGLAVELVRFGVVIEGGITRQ